MDIRQNIWAGFYGSLQESEVVPPEVLDSLKALKANEVTRSEIMSAVKRGDQENGNKRDQGK